MREPQNKTCTLSAEIVVSRMVYHLTSKVSPHIPSFIFNQEVVYVVRRRSTPCTTKANTYIYTRRCCPEVTSFRPFLVTSQNCAAAVYFLRITGPTGTKILFLRRCFNEILKRFVDVQRETPTSGFRCAETNSRRLFNLPPMSATVSRRFRISTTALCRVSI